MTSLFDTAHAALNAILALLPLLVLPQPISADLSFAATKFLLAASGNATSSSQQLTLAQTRFRLTAADAEHSFRVGTHDAQAFARILDTALTEAQAPTSHPGIAAAFAEAVVTFNSATAEGTDEAQNLAAVDLRWTLMTHALKILATADADVAKADSPKSLVGATEANDESEELPSRAAINARRGDLEMLRAALSEPPWSHKAAINNASTLWGNAAKFYAGAKKLAAQDDEVDAGEMEVREAFVRAILGDTEILDRLVDEDEQKMKALLAQGQAHKGVEQNLKDVLTEMLDEGLMSRAMVVNKGLVRLMD